MNKDTRSMTHVQIVMAMTMSRWDIVEVDSYDEYSIEHTTVYNSGNGIRQNTLMLFSPYTSRRSSENRDTASYWRLEAISPVTGIIYKTLLANHSKASENTLAAWILPLPESFQVWSELLGIPPALK